MGLFFELFWANKVPIRNFHVAVGNLCAVATVFQRPVSLELVGGPIQYCSAQRPQVHLGGGCDLA